MSGAESSLDLLARARAGDDEALNRLAARYLPRMRRWASGRLPRWTRDLAETDDLVQDCMLQTFRRIDRSTSSTKALCRPICAKRL
jgi:RNA polymerase sigma-70 factor (ECF subfamily)